MSKTTIVAGMAYGDEAKGATVDFLCREQSEHGIPSLVVRYNGGHQAAHNVVLTGGRHHTFSQFGSGTFLPWVSTHLSKYMLVNPSAMLMENEHLESLGITDAFARTTVDENCVVVTPYHRAFNRLEEISRGHRANGSCGVGIGTCRRLSLDGLALKVEDLQHPRRAIEIIDAIHKRLLSEFAGFSYLLYTQMTAEIMQEVDLLQTTAQDLHPLYENYEDWLKLVRLVPRMEPHQNMVFEGAQGVLLDETHGIAPHNTWSNTTFENAIALLQECGYTGIVSKMGCFRSYYTRHGYGPFPTEDSDLTLERYPERHNTHGRFQGAWRIGNFDYTSAAAAVKICGGVDEIAVSHMDIRVLPTGEGCELLRVCQAPVTIKATGPTHRDRYREGENNVGVRLRSLQADNVSTG